MSAPGSRARTQRQMELTSSVFAFARRFSILSDFCSFLLSTLGPFACGGLGLPGGPGG